LAAEPVIYNAPVYDNKAKVDYEMISRMIDTDLNSHTKITTEEGLEEFIVLKMVRDVQMPRLASDDYELYSTICQDIFFKVPVAKIF